jgi:predicted nucleotidyltransferase component of viral defense system
LSKGQLSPLQEEVLSLFFQREDRFFLTGGAALAGFHLKHRRTADLDLFATDIDCLDAGDAALRSVAAQLGASLKNLQTEPGMRRRLLERGSDRVVVDLVVEQTVQGYPEKTRIGEVRVDPPAEIFANKLCALLSRSEVRDLVDVRALELAGENFDDALSLAMRKDTGLTPATLAWVLSDIEIGDDARIPGGVTPEELRTFIAGLVARLSRAAYPSGGGTT